MHEIRLVESKFSFIVMHKCYEYYLHINVLGFTFVFCVIMVDLINGRRVVLPC